MKTVSGRILLEDIDGFTPDIEGIDYIDISGAVIRIPLPVLIRLYEGTKYVLEKRGVGWEDFCSSLFKGKDNASVEMS